MLAWWRRSRRWFLVGSSAAQVNASGMCLLCQSFRCTNLRDPPTYVLPAEARMVEKRMKSWWYRRQNFTTHTAAVIEDSPLASAHRRAIRRRRQERAAADRDEEDLTLQMISSAASSSWRAPRSQPPPPRTLRSCVGCAKHRQAAARHRVVPPSRSRRVGTCTGDEDEALRIATVDPRRLSLVHRHVS